VRVVDLSCHCGAVRLTVEAAPEAVTDCNCSLCRSYGALWAYYPPGQVSKTGGATDIYMWGDRMIEFHRCAVCGCVTHWSSVDAARDRMGVNAKLMASEVLAAARVRRLDGADTWAYLND